jgi:hypothetical protein
MHGSECFYIRKQRVPDRFGAGRRGNEKLLFPFVSAPRTPGASRHDP